MCCVVVEWEAQLEEKMQLEVRLLYLKTRRSLLLEHRHIGPLGEIEHMVVSPMTRRAAIHQITIYGLMGTSVDSA